jgi:dTDP-4-amino-4,6-dideoxygalactose transaminase
MSLLTAGFGDGGAVLTNNKDIYNKIKLMRDHGRGEDGNISVWGYNSRLIILEYIKVVYVAINCRRQNHTVNPIYTLIIQSSYFPSTLNNLLVIIKKII